MSSCTFSPVHLLQAPAPGGATPLLPTSTDPLCITPTASERGSIPILKAPALQDATS